MTDGFSNKEAYKKPKLCVSGAAETSHCGSDAMERAKELGKQIAFQGGILLTGATTGFPFWAAVGAKEAGGVVIGISPAAGEREHREVYRLPVEYHDLIIYTGFGYAGRDILLTRSSDAVFIGCGRIGTVHEFTVAFEDRKPIGVLEGAWSMDETLRDIINRSNRKADKIIFDPKADALVASVLTLVTAERKENLMSSTYRRPE